MKASRLLLGAATGCAVGLACYQLYATHHPVYATELIVAFMPIVVLILDQRRNLADLWPSDKWTTRNPSFRLLVPCLAVGGANVLATILLWIAALNEASTSGISAFAQVAQLHWFWVTNGILVLAWAVAAWVVTIRVTPRQMREFWTWSASTGDPFALRITVIVLMPFVAVFIATAQMAPAGFVFCIYHNARTIAALTYRFAPIIEPSTRLIDQLEPRQAQAIDARLPQSLLVIHRYRFQKQTDQFTPISPDEFWSWTRPITGYNPLATAEEVKAVVAVTRVPSPFRSYSPGGSDAQWVFYVHVVSWPEGRLLASHSFAGSLPPDRSGSPAGGSMHFGSEPWNDVSTWLKELQQP